MFVALLVRKLQVWEWETQSHLLLDFIVCCYFNIFIENVIIKKYHFYSVSLHSGSC